MNSIEEEIKKIHKVFTFKIPKNIQFTNSLDYFILSQIFFLLSSSFFFLQRIFFCVQKLLFLSLFSLPKYTMLLCALNPLHIPPHTCFVVDLFFLKTAFFRIPFCVKVLKILKNSHTK